MTQPTNSSNKVYTNLYTTFSTFKPGEKGETRRLKKALNESSMRDVLYKVGNAIADSKAKKSDIENLFKLKNLFENLQSAEASKGDNNSIFHVRSKYVFPFINSKQYQRDIKANRMFLKTIIGAIDRKINEARFQDCGKLAKNSPVFKEMLSSAYQGMTAEKYQALTDDQRTTLEKQSPFNYEEYVTYYEKVSKAPEFRVEIDKLKADIRTKTPRGQFDGITKGYYSISNADWLQNLRNKNRGFDGDERCVLMVMIALELDPKALQNAIGIRPTHDDKQDPSGKAVGCLDLLKNAVGYINQRIDKPTYTKIEKSTPENQLTTTLDKISKIFTTFTQDPSKGIKWVLSRFQNSPAMRAVFDMTKGLIDNIDDYKQLHAMVNLKNSLESLLDKETELYEKTPSSTLLVSKKNWTWSSLFAKRENPDRDMEITWTHNSLRNLIIAITSKISLLATSQANMPVLKPKFDKILEEGFKNLALRNDDDRKKTIEKLPMESLFYHVYQSPQFAHVTEYLSMKLGTLPAEEHIKTIAEFLERSINEPWFKEILRQFGHKLVMEADDMIQLMIITLLKTNISPKLILLPGDGKLEVIDNTLAMIYAGFLHINHTVDKPPVITPAPVVEPPKQKKLSQIGNLFARMVPEMPTLPGFSITAFQV